uniref:C-type lectin domain-containing protein n=1 Tax=Malurus cyaneus samueli TaxID=2593467 RepID=A0A8C5UDB3_9PASS
MPSGLSVCPAGSPQCVLGLCWKVLKAPTSKMRELGECQVFFMPFPHGLSQDFSLRYTKDRKVIIGVTVHLGMLCLFSSKKCPPCTAPTLPRCLDSGISFGNKLFYFLEEEVDWEGSQHSCLSHQAHLATIDTREELHFLLHYGNFKEYWVGLQREGSRPWKWLNDSLFSSAETLSVEISPFAEVKANDCTKPKSIKKAPLGSRW